MNGPKSSGKSVGTQQSASPTPGLRFSHVYLERGEPTEDSPRMRRRIAAMIANSDTSFGDKVRMAAEAELGIDVPYGAWAKALAECDLRDVLDLITVVYREALRVEARGAEQWVQDVRRVFSEENVHYTVDQTGGVRFQFDEGSRATARPR